MKQNLDETMKLEERSLQISFSRSLHNNEKSDQPYISPDEGIPDKRLKDMYSRSNASVS